MHDLKSHLTKILIRQESPWATEQYLVRNILAHLVRVTSCATCACGKCMISKEVGSGRLHSIKNVKAKHITSSERLSDTMCVP